MTEAMEKRRNGQELAVILRALPEDVRERFYYMLMGASVLNEGT